MQAPLKKLRVLVVDDHASSREALSALLAHDGWAVTTAADGAAAIGLLTGGYQPDLIVTDYMMPGLDGLAMLNRINGHPDIPAIPAVLVSSDHLPVSRSHELVDRYFRKPFDGIELLNAAQELSAA